MKQLLILSGKGGTGKTTIAAALIEMSRCRALADCDVDAPNLHLVIAGGEKAEESDYFGLGKASVDPSACVGCNLCGEVCRFGAIQKGEVLQYACEGCGVCAWVCPQGAITMVDDPSGTMMLFREEDRVFSTAQLKIGGAASGKLVSAVKSQLLDHAGGAPFAVIDGSPGIGCPVIASVSGVDLVLVVAEPTLSGAHDMRRILETARHFQTPAVVCINKYDLDPEQTEAMERECAERGIPVIGEIPFDKTVVEAVNQNKSIAAFPGSPACKAVASVWNRLEKMISEKGEV